MMDQKHKLSPAKEPDFTMFHIDCCTALLLLIKYNHNA
jgi:hypothetical protein